ncbi:MAG: hypothetical protein KF809_09870 [Chloroflexi bacterium]|nr:hypothetical protein [Chloroflexota bacterium]
MRRRLAAWRWPVAGAIVGLLLGLAWVAVAASTAPLRVSCDSAVPADVCAETADAGLRRGMPRLHPLIVEAAVGPGPAFPDGYGHRATVTYSLFPGPSVNERLFFDAGGHWGAIPDQSDVALALWALLPAAAMTAIGALAGWAIGRRRWGPRSVRRTPGPERSAVEPPPR